MARFKRVFVLAVTTLLCGAKIVQASSVYDSQTQYQRHGYGQWEGFYPS